MTIYGVAIMALCTLLGEGLGDLLGAARRHGGACPRLRGGDRRPGRFSPRFAPDALRKPAMSPSFFDHLVASHALIVAFAFVGVVMWISNLISNKATRGRVHGSAIAI